MFSNSIKELSFAKVKKVIYEKQVSVEQVRNVLQKAASLERLSEEDFLVLLSDTSFSIAEELRAVSLKISEQRHGKAIRFYTPLYVSNECDNHCLYCGFNQVNEIERLTLSEPQALKEAEEIRKMGIEHLLLVAGEKEKKLTVEYLSSLVEKLSEMFSSISIEIAPLNEDGYSHLFSKGVEGVISYQETYSRDSYTKHHPRGPKSNIENRLNTLDRAGISGMRILGLGVLLGLEDYKTEAYFLARHARYLERKYWRSQISISFPRIRYCSSKFDVPHPVSDEELLFIISVMRLFFPDANLIMSTRERENLRDEAIVAGINQISAGSRTSPLAYVSEMEHNKEAGKQFEIADKRTVDQISRRVSELGYDPVYKDWDRGFRS